MTIDEHADISEAKEFFERFEQVKDHSERIRHFEDALDILDLYLPDQDTSQAGRIAMNLRRTYTKKLLEWLSSLFPIPDTREWFLYYWRLVEVLIERLPKEVDILCAENQALRKNYDEFCGIWLDNENFIRAVQKRLETRSA